MLLKEKNPFMSQDKSTRLLIVSILLSFMTSIISFAIGLILMLINNGIFPAICIIVSLGGVITVSGGVFMLCLTKLYSKNEVEDKTDDSAKSN